MPLFFVCRNNLALTEDLLVGRIGLLHALCKLLKLYFVGSILVDPTKDLLLKEISFHVITGHSENFERNHPYLVQSRGGILLVGGKWYW